MAKICNILLFWKQFAFVPPACIIGFPGIQKTFPSTLSHAKEIYIGFSHRQIFLSFFLLISLPASKVVRGAEVAAMSLPDEYFRKYFGLQDTTKPEFLCYIKKCEICK